MNRERYPIPPKETSPTSNREPMRTERDIERIRIEEDLPRQEEIEAAIDEIRTDLSNAELIKEAEDKIDLAALNARPVQTESVIPMKRMKEPTPTPPTLLKRVGSFLGGLFRKNEKKPPFTDKQVRDIRAQLTELRLEEEAPSATTYAKATREATEIPMPRSEAGTHDASTRDDAPVKKAA